MHPAVDRIFDGTGEDLAAGHVAFAVAVDEGAPGDGERQIDVRPADFDPILALEPVDQPLLFVVDPLPTGDRIRLVGIGGGVDKVLVLAQAHVGFLGIGRTGILGQRPAVLARGRALHEPLPLHAVGALFDLLALGVDVRQVARVGRGARSTMRASNCSAIIAVAGETQESCASLASSISAAFNSSAFN